MVDCHKYSPLDTITHITLSYLYYCKVLTPLKHSQTMVTVRGPEFSFPFSMFLNFFVYAQAHIKREHNKQLIQTSTIASITFHLYRKPRTFQSKNSTHSTPMQNNY